MTLDLGTTSLTEARLARGLTLEDAERSTRISRKFLIALEEHDYSVFPAPVYARGFLRTYCRYLGIDPDVQLAELPAGWTESPSAHTTQLTPVPTRAPMPINFNFAWVFAGVILAAVIGLGLFLSRGDEGLGDLERQGLAQQDQGVAGATTNEVAATGADSQPTTSPTQASTNTRRVLEPGLPGVLPDFENVDAEDAETFLEQQDIAYLRIETSSATVPEGLVISQVPEAGSETAGIGQVTLTVSSGSTPALTNRTDCGVLEASNQRTAAEQAYFEDNCAGAGGTSVQSLPDRTSCAEIRGTDYRSPAERTFFLTNCIIQ